MYLDGEDYGSWHNGWLLDNGFGLNEYPRDQANTALTWFAGESHELKFGVDWQEVSWLQDVRRQSLYSGAGFSATSPTGFSYPCGILETAVPDGDVYYCFFQDYNPADMVAQGRGNADSTNENLTLYGRDRFTIGDHWTFVAGLRLSGQENTNDLGNKVVDTETVEPRLAVTYDVQGDSTLLVSLNVGRYYAQLNQQFTNEWLMEEWTGWNAYDTYPLLRRLRRLRQHGGRSGGAAGLHQHGVQLPVAGLPPG